MGVFSPRRKADVDCVLFSSVGSWFHALGAAAENARSAVFVVYTSNTPTEQLQTDIRTQMFAVFAKLYSSLMLHFGFALRPRQHVLITDMLQESDSFRVYLKLQSMK